MLKTRAMHSERLKQASADPSCNLQPVRWLDAGMAIVDGSGTILEVNSALADWLGKDREDLLGRAVEEVLYIRCPAWRTAVLELLRGSGAFVEARLEVKMAGKQPAQQLRVELTRHKAAQFLRIASVLPDELEERAWASYLKSASARRELYLRMRRSEVHLEQLMQRWPGVVFNQRPDCTFQYISPVIEEWTGIPAGRWQSKSSCFWEAIHEGDVEQVQQALRGASRARKEMANTYRLRHVKTGRVIYILEHRKPVYGSNGALQGYEGLWLEVTRQIIAEKRLGSAAWKETLATLTMGLGHDLSNMLAGVLGLAENLHVQVPADHPFHEALGLIGRNAQEGCRLVKRIMQLHRDRADGKNYHDLNGLVSDVADLLQKLGPRGIKTGASLCPKQLPVYVDAFELRQVLVNLALNGYDAMRQGGELLFVTARHESQPELPFLHGTMPNFPAVSVEVSDTGVGIAEKHLPLIFDPFFTTKAVNKGSGLGLYNARLFIEKHHGAISVASSAGGTRIRLWLPEADFSETERQASGGGQRHTLLLLGAPGEALASTAEFLRQHDFYVVMAASDEEAAEFLRSPFYQFGAVVVQTTVGSVLLFDEIARQNFPLKTVLQVVARNPDEIEAQLLSKIDLIIPADTPGQEMLSRMRSLLD
jgi:signal transduction histidine kinase